MEEKQGIPIEAVLQEYKQMVSNLIHENTVLLLRIKQLTEAPKS